MWARSQEREELHFGGGRGGGGPSLAQIKLPILNGRLSHNIGNDIVLPEQGSYLPISESEKWNVVLNDATDRELAVKADKDAV